MIKAERQMRAQIEDNVNKSGYPLELYLHSLLSRKGYLVFPNDYFFDPDKNEARTIDFKVYGFETGPGTNDNFPLSISMVIECKKQFEVLSNGFMNVKNGTIGYR